LVTPQVSAGFSLGIKLRHVYNLLFHKTSLNEPKNKKKDLLKQKKEIEMLDF
jgi:hypothetical protein